MTHADIVHRSPQRFASHWLTASGKPAPQGYGMLARIGTIAIWRRRDDPVKDLVVPGYGTYASFLRSGGDAAWRATPRW